jgi:hypothetical protein
MSTACINCCRVFLLLLMFFVPFIILVASVKVVYNWDVYRDLSHWPRNAAQVMYFIMTLIGLAGAQTHTRIPWTSIPLDFLAVPIVAFCCCLMSITWTAVGLGEYRVACVDIVANFWAWWYLTFLWAHYFGPEDTRSPSDSHEHMP